MTFYPGQLISHKSSTPSVVSNANGTPSLMDILTGKKIGCGTLRGKLYYLDWALGSEVKCDTCELAKSHRVPFPLSSNKSLVPYSLVHFDVWGPAKIATPAGAQWFVKIIDDCTRMTWVSLLKIKGEVSSRFQQFYQMVETQFHARIQVLRSDNGGEFVNHDLNQFLQDHGIIHQRSCPYAPQQNGVAERKNRHLLEVVRSSLFGANMPRSFWGEPSSLQHTLSIGFPLVS
ncbi:unnamed protein product [Prunus brigantina]